MAKDLSDGTFHFRIYRRLLLYTNIFYVVMAGKQDVESAFEATDAKDFRMSFIGLSIKTVTAQNHNIIEQDERNCTGVFFDEEGRPSRVSKLS